jgi:hypothetical protein
MTGLSDSFFCGRNAPDDIVVMVGGAGTAAAGQRFSLPV